MNTQPDQELVDAVLGGDRTAYAQLVRRYERVVIASAYRILGDTHAAQDAAQEAFLAAYEKLGVLRVRSRFGAWVLNIVRRKALSLVRRDLRMCGLDSIDEPVAPDPLALEDERRWVLAAAAELPAHERIVVFLRYVDQHSVHEVADITGRPVGTVTKQLSRAVRRLRELLREVEQ